jgi:hypothetical protein
VKRREAAGDKFGKKCVHCSSTCYRDLNGIDNDRVIKNGKLGYISNPDHGKATNMITCWKCAKTWCWNCGVKGEDCNAAGLNLADNGGDGSGGAKSGIRAHFNMCKPWSCGFFGMLNEYKPGYMLFYCILIQMLYPLLHIIFFGFGSWLSTIYSLGKKCEKQCGFFIWIAICTVMLPWELLFLELILILTGFTLICGFAWSACRLCRVCASL